MADSTTDTNPGLGAPIMPTGSGVADLEIAREQDALAQANAQADAGNEEAEDMIDRQPPGGGVA